MDEVSKKEIEELKLLRSKMIRAMKKCFVFALCSALLVSLVANFFVQSDIFSTLLFSILTFIFSFVASCIIYSWKIAGFHSEYVFDENNYKPFEGINRSIEHHAFMERHYPFSYRK